jgi:hypothetical protein
MEAREEALVEWSAGAVVVHPMNAVAHAAMAAAPQMLRKLMFFMVQPQ